MTDTLIDKAKDLTAATFPLNPGEWMHDARVTLNALIARCEAAEKVCDIASYPSWTPEQVAVFRAWTDIRDAKEGT